MEIIEGNRGEASPAENQRNLASVWQRIKFGARRLMIGWVLSLVVFSLTGCVFLGPPREVVQPAGVEIRRDITFATVNNRELKLDLYLPEGVQGRLPVVLWLHAGGWFRGSRSPCPIALLATRGYVVAAVEYRHSSSAPFPAQLYDVKAAVRWLRQNPDPCHADPDRVGVWGASAGGTLACLLGLTAEDPGIQGLSDEPIADTSVKCVVALFPPTDLERLFTNEFPPSFQMRHSVRWLLGGAEPKEKRELARQASPINWVRPGVAPHLIVHGGRDRLIPVQHSVDYVNELARADVGAQAFVVGGFAHSSRIIADHQVREQINTFLDRHLKPQSATVMRSPTSR